MSRELTWKNIDAPDLVPAASMMNRAFDRFSSTISGIGDFFKQSTAEQDAEVQRAKDYYTNQAVTEFMLKARNSPDTVDQYMDGITYGDDPTGYLLENFVVPGAQRVSAMTGSVAPTAPLFDVNKLTTAIMAAEPTIRANLLAQDTFRQGELFKADMPALNKFLVKVAGFTKEKEIDSLIESPLGFGSRQAEEQARNALLTRRAALAGERRAAAQEARAASEEARQVKLDARRDAAYKQGLAATEAMKQKALAKANLDTRFATNPFVGKTAETSSMDILKGIAETVNEQGLNKYWITGLDPTDNKGMLTQLNKLDNLAIDFPVPNGKGGSTKQSIVVRLPDDLRRAVIQTDAYNGSEGSLEKSIDKFVRLVSVLPTLSPKEQKDPIAALERRGVDIGDRTELLQLAKETLGYVAYQQELKQIDATGVPPANPSLATQILLEGAAAGDYAAQQIAARTSPTVRPVPSTKFLKQAKEQQEDPRLKALWGR